MKKQVGKKARRLFIAAVLALSAGCADGKPGAGALPSDADLSTQIKEYVNSWDSGKKIYEFGGQPKQKWFQIESVMIKDKMVKDESLKVICDVTVRALRQFDGGSSIGDLYHAIGGSGAGVRGQTSSGQATFEFEKWDSGWRLKRTYGECPFGDCS